ncbi:MAG TPA: FxsA family protein [Acidimicrobiia bacterium]|nr:FxsA family protein [Acidimicrobiia bacterium]
MRLLSVFVLVSLAEMAAFLWVGSQIGFAWALGIALATAVIGAFLVKREGLSTLGRIKARMNAGQVPGRELSDGAAILVAGAFLMSPGFITDTIGFLLLVPSVRTRVHRVLSRRVTARFNVFVPGNRSRAAEPVIIDVEAID